MNDNAEFLNFVYQNSGMGVTTINELVKISTDPAFHKHLSDELSEYTAFHAEAKKKLNENGFDEKGISSMAKMGTYLSIKMDTMTDKTPSKMAEMMIIGSNMGIIQATRKLRQYPEVEQSIRDLMQRLLTFEENNVKVLKGFL